MCEEDLKLKAENAEICTQRLICLQKAILNNPEIMKGIGAKNRYTSNGMAGEVFHMSRILYEKSLDFAKNKFN